MIKKVGYHLTTYTLCDVYEKIIKLYWFNVDEINYKSDLKITLYNFERKSPWHKNLIKKKKHEYTIGNLKIGIFVACMGHELIYC